MIELDIRVPVKYTKDDVRLALLDRAPLSVKEVRDFLIVKRRLVAKDTSDIHYKMSVALSLSTEREEGLLKIRNKVRLYDGLHLDLPDSRLASRPLVVGAGPAGLFAALTLAEAGARPIIVERGLKLEERDAQVKKFFLTGKLDTECNIQFGEGGAGTYSDGKLKVGSHDKYKMYVLRSLVEAGAPEEVLYSMDGHLGTDKLSGITRGIRERLISLGAEFYFSTRLTGIILKDGKVTGARLERFGKEEIVETESIVLAVGHSARDTFRMLKETGVVMEARGFGIGVRIEHPREHIDRMFYGEGMAKDLCSASYHLVTHLPSGRSVYSFCMCPGGTVVAATSAEGAVVTNGMSEYLRDGENSNAAFLVSVTSNDFDSADPLSGFELQKRIEEAAFRMGGGDYKAPAIRMEDFLLGNAPSTPKSVRPTYQRGITPASAESYLPTYITDSLRAAIKDFEAYAPGFYLPDAVLTGAETRSTSPVRILRGEDCAALGISGLYPAGEGGGYAGGIISSAADGVKVAVALLSSACSKNKNK